MMMTAPDTLALRTIFVHPLADAATTLPTHRLLTDLGHNVVSTNSMDEAIRLSASQPIDLLILEENYPAGHAADGSFKQDVLNQIGELPPAHRPRNVAIFADRADDFATEQRKRSTSPRVHVFFKPLHMHGLLHVLRTLESRSDM